MAFCRNCGQEIHDNAVICNHCGVAQTTVPGQVDNGGFGWGLLGCCIPVAGLVLFLIWKDNKPKTAKAKFTSKTGAKKTGSKNTTKKK